MIQAINTGSDQFGLESPYALFLRGTNYFAVDHKKEINLRDIPTTSLKNSRWMTLLFFSLMTSSGVNFGSVAFSEFLEFCGLA